MTDGSRLLLLEMVVPTGNTPAYAKLLDLLMLVYAGGRERTEAEYRDLLTSTGFSMKRVVPTASAISIIEATAGLGRRMTIGHRGRSGPCRSSLRRSIVRP